MKSILLATNENENLSHLGEHFPLPLVPIANRPLMVYGVELLVQHSVKEIIVCHRDDSGEIENRIGDGKRWNVRLRHLKPRHTFGVADAIQHAREHLNERFLVMPADRLVDLDIPAMTTFHESHGGPLTVVLWRLPSGVTSTSAKIVGHGDRVLLPSSIMDDDKLYYTGACLVEPEIFDYITTEKNKPLQSDLIGEAIEAGVEVHGYQMDGYWNPMDSFPAYAHAQKTALHSLLSAEAPSAEVVSDEVPDDEVLSDEGPVYLPTIRNPYVDARQVQPGIWCYQDTPIHHSIHLVPPVLIGKGCRIGRNAEIGPNVVIGANAIIDDGANIQNSTILGETYVGKLLNVHQKVVSKELLIDTNSGEWAKVEDSTLLAETNPAIVTDILENSVERFVALLAMIVLLPLLILLMLVVWLGIGSPVLYRTKRSGQRPQILSLGQPPKQQVLSIYHLRTRNPNGTVAFIGQWIERWNLHRLPELVNVVQGDLSLFRTRRLTKAARF